MTERKDDQLSFFEDSVLRLAKSEIFKPSRRARTFDEVKSDFWERVEKSREGARCPCCNRLGKRYKRALHASPALGLLMLERLDRVHPDQFFHVSAIERQCLRAGSLPRNVMGDFAKNAYWGLIEEKPKDTGDERGGRTSGFWRMTDKGRLFARGDLAIPRHAILLSGELVGFSGEAVTIRVCLGKKFDYEELMRS